MRTDFVITMDKQEKEEYAQIAVETKALLSEMAGKITDPKERSEAWDKIRDYNRLMKVFTDD